MGEHGMTKKRWFALLGAAVLFIVSVISQLGTSAITTDWSNLFDDENVKETVKENGTGKKIASIPLEGVIQDEDTDSILSVGDNSYQEFLTMLEHAAEDKAVDGIVIEVDSPGGGVVESAEIHEKIKEAQEEHDKPVYISMGNMAASGGYYVAAPADKIVAHPATTTGSIGVIMESINFSELADDLGVDFNTIKSGKHKDIMSEKREMTDEEHDILQTIIDENYDEFVDVIADGRDMDEDKVRELGDGRIYTGKQAEDNGLVDELGSFDDTVDMMADENDWKNPKVVEYDIGIGGFDSIADATAAKWMGEDSDVQAVKELMKESDSPRAMYLYSE